MWVLLYNINMNWDYRVIQHTDRYSVHQVYYDEQGEAVGFVPEPAQPVGETVEQLSHNLIHLMGALTKPVIASDQLLKQQHRDHTVKTALDIARTGKSDV